MMSIIQKIKGFLLIFIFLAPTVSSFSQTTFFDLGTVQKIEIFFADPDWDYTLDTMKLGAGGYLKADSVRINGTNFTEVGVKYKGNSSYDSSKVKNPFTIKLDKYISQNYEGVKSIKLANCYDDPSMIREVLAYHILSHYMHCPRSNFAEVYVNGYYLGLYSNDEDITKPFVLKHFYSSGNTFIKCSPALASPLNKSNLKYIDANVDSYKSLYELESSADSGWDDLVDLCESITDHPADVATVIDIDRAIWMLAFDNVLVNLDSYIGVFAQNYFLYLDNTGHYNPIVWDLNMAFGGFNFAGSPNFGMGTMTATDMQQLSPIYHATHTDWPLIKAVMENDTFKRMYMAHFRTIVDEIFASGYYETVALQLQATADQSVAADTNKFFSYNAYQDGLIGDIVINGRTVPGIKNLMEARIPFLQGHAEFVKTAPVITSINCNNYNPVPGDVVSVLAQVNGANDVYFAYRNDSTLKFTRILMYDDGLHNDGAAGDQLYGVSFTMTSDYAAYYIYAENQEAGIFSPARAEHEFYTLPGDAPGLGTTTIPETQKLVSVYPNPAQNIVHITIPEANLNQQIQVIDMLGKVVYQQQATPYMEIYTGKWSGGTYFIRYANSSTQLLITR